MLFQQLGHSRFELAAVITLEYVGIDERANLVNVGSHVSYVFCLFHFHRPGDFLSGSNVDSGENLLVLIPV